MKMMAGRALTFPKGLCLFLHEHPTHLSVNTVIFFNLDGQTNTPNIMSDSHNTVVLPK